MVFGVSKAGKHCKLHSFGFRTMPQNPFKIHGFDLIQAQKNVGKYTVLASQRPHSHVKRMVLALSERENIGKLHGFGFQRVHKVM